MPRHAAGHDRGTTRQALEALGPPPPPGVEVFSASAWVFSVAVVGFALVGALIVTRVAGNPLGWFLTAFAVLMVTSPLAHQYAIARLPGWTVAAWVAAWLWIVPIGVLAEAMLRFPDGHRPSRAWRWVSYAATAGIVASIAVGVALWPARGLALLTVGDQFPGVADAIAGVALPLVFGSFVAAAVSLVVRQRHSAPVERLQLRWVTYAVGVAATGLVAFATATCCSAASSRPSLTSSAAWASSACHCRCGSRSAGTACTRSTA